MCQVKWCGKICSFLDKILRGNNKYNCGTSVSSSRFRLKIIWKMMEMKAEDGNLSILVVEIREKTCDCFKGYVSRNLKLVTINVINIVIDIILSLIIMVIFWQLLKLVSKAINVFRHFKNCIGSNKCVHIWEFRHASLF